MKAITRVFISGPYSGGDQMANVRAALDAAQELLNHGFVPFVPHLNAFWHMIHPNKYETWLTYDLAWLESCDAVVRLPGDSPGADGEVRRAWELGLPVFGSVQEMVWWTWMQAGWSDTDDR